MVHFLFSNPEGKDTAQQAPGLEVFWYAVSHLEFVLTVALVAFDLVFLNTLFNCAVFKLISIVVTADLALYQGNHKVSPMNARNKK
jgi:hypothetical protein